MGSEYVYTFTKFIYCPNKDCSKRLTTMLQFYEYPQESPKEVHNLPYFV